MDGVGPSSPGRANPDFRLEIHPNARFWRIREAVPCRQPAQVHAPGGSIEITGEEPIMTDELDDPFKDGKFAHKHHGGAFL